MEDYPRNQAEFDARFRIRVRIEFVPVPLPLHPGAPPPPGAWTEFRYWAYSLVVPKL